MLGDLAEAGGAGQQLEQRLVVLAEVDREPRAGVREAEATLGREEAAYVILELRTVGESHEPRARPANLARFYFP
jgi:hypothetical protein